MPRVLLIICVFFLFLFYVFVDIR